MEPTLQSAAEAVRSALNHARHGLIEREVVTELIALATIAHEHLLIIGPPGTAKSVTVRRVAEALHGQYFEYLLGRFTEPNEIFGPVDLRRLKEGTVEIDTTDMLPEAAFAFLDEIFLGSTAILNTLLGILNERRFRRGATYMECPLRICVGASNALPEDESLAAFSDRFLLHLFVDAIPDAHLEDLLAGGWALTQKDETQTTASLEHIDLLAKAAAGMDLSAVRPFLADAIRTLRKAGIHLSDRRIVKTQGLIAAAAALAGRETPTTADLWPLVFVVPTREDQQLARDVLGDRLRDSANQTLSAAAEDASLGPAVRAQRLLAEGEALMGERADMLDTEATAAWHQKLEAFLRELDASLDSNKLPEELAALRERMRREFET